MPHVKNIFKIFYILFFLLDVDYCKLLIKEIPDLFT